MSLSSRPEADLQLAESEQRYRAVIDNASDMIQSVRADGTFEFVNQAWLNALGYTAEEVAELDIWKIIHPSSVEHCMEAFGKVMAGETVPSMEAVFAAKDGHPVPVEGSVTVRMLGDKVVASHGFFRDVTERLRAQELERRNAELVRDEQARRLEKMAALGKLSAGLAHELNNPAAAVQRASVRLSEALDERDSSLRELVVNGITAERCQQLADLASAAKAHAELLDPIERDSRETVMEDLLDELDVGGAWRLASVLVDAGLTPDTVRALAAELPAGELEPTLRWAAAARAASESVDVLTRSSHRISELVQAVKGYTHMDRAAEQHVDVHEGIESTLTILHHQLRDVTVVRDFDTAIPPVRVLGNTLNQVWTNILDNAADATGGRGTITIRTRRDGEHAVVEIEDDGPGISPEVRSRIFEPFFTTKPQGQGTGLGLDTVWRIITDEHGGTIEVQSEPGRTVFRVTLPLQA